jgi:8-oxo-dGTP pyrophosphatase MutT (NUDIX family)
MVREAREEIGYTLINPSYVGNYPFDGYDIHFFLKRDLSLDINKLVVKEGQCGQLFTIDQIRTLPCAFNAKEAILSMYEKNIL